MYMVAHAILTNDTRINKVKSLKGIRKQRQKIRNFVIGECATQKKRLTESEIRKAVAYIENRM